MSNTPIYRGYIIIIGVILLLLCLLSYETNRRNEFLGTITGIRVVGSVGSTGKLCVKTENNLYKQSDGLLTSRQYKYESCVFLLCKYALVIFSFIISMWAMMHYDMGATDSKGYPIC